MSERDLELRLVDWYQAETAEVPGAVLRARIRAIPERPSRALGRRMPWLLAAALLMLGLLLAGGLVVGAQVIRTAPSSDWLGVDPGSVDTAALLARAVERAGQKQGSMKGCHAGPDGPRPTTSWGAETCFNTDWDGDWAARHLLFRVEATTIEEAARLLLLDLLPQQAVSNEWELVAPGTWVTAPVDESRTRWPPDEPQIHLAAVAISSEPIFFIVTGRTVPEVRDLAEAVLAELREMPRRPDWWARSEGSP